MWNEVHTPFQGKTKDHEKLYLEHDVEVNLRRLLALGKSDLSGLGSFARIVPFVGLFLRCCCARKELITPDLICPLTYQLLQNSGGDSGLDLSFDKSAYPERLFSSARVSLAEASKPDLSFRCSEGDYTSLCPPSLVCAKLASHDLLPRLPLEDFVMSELSDDAIGIYHRMFAFFGVQLPFSSFLLALIKHYRVHFSQLGPLGLNKVITFEVLCRSLQIEPTSGFFFIDRRAILDAMVWRHLDAAIDDPRPTAGSFNMADVRRLSAHVIKLRDMPEGVLVLSGLSHIWKSRVCDLVLRGADGNVMGIHDFLCLPEWTGVEIQEEPHLDLRPTLQRLSFCCTPPATADAVIPDPTPEDLAIGTPSSNIVCLGSIIYSTTRPSLFVGDDDEIDDDDDDACVEISLVTPLHSVVVIPSSGNQGGSFVPSAAEGSNTRESRGKGVMVDDVAAPSAGVSRPRSSFGPAPSFRDVSGDAIGMC
ncbi:hypothetical protein Tco_0211692 [Tanacetum coccineum]